MTTKEMLEKEAFIKEQLAYRIPRSFGTIIIGNDGYSYFRCPSCGGHVQRDYQAYCCECGQALDWDGIHFEDDFPLDDE